MGMSENEFQISYRYSDDVVGSFRPNQLAILRAIALMPRQILGSNQIIRAMNAIKVMMNNTGWFSAAYMPPITAMSSPMESVQFEKGSGEVFTTARVPILVAWVAADNEPPSIIAASSPA